MKNTLLALLAAAVMPSLAPAQLVVSDGASFATGDFYHYDLTCGTTTALPLGLSPVDLAADEAGAVLYLVTRSPGLPSKLYSWPYAAPAPMLVGEIRSAGVGLEVLGMTFGNGRLYVATNETASKPCRYPIYELDPAGPSAATLFYDPGNGFFGSGIGFDSSSGLLILAKVAFKPPFCAAIQDGLYTLDPLTLTRTLLTTFPGQGGGLVSGFCWGGITVGGGKVWWAGYCPGFLFPNFDLTTLTWDANPPSHPIGSGFGPKLGVTWSPTLVAQGSCGPVSYCTSGTSASGCSALLATTGTPSATASSGFTLEASGVEGQKNGVFLFAANGRQANPWGNGSSYQCVVPPVFRGGLLTGSGTGGSCDGAFSQDLNALWCATCPQPAKNPGAGAVAQAQLWYRDPFSTSNQTSSFSDGVEFTVQP